MARGITEQEPDPRVVYADIIRLPHHQSPVRPHMSMHDRAAQFSPFAMIATSFLIIFLERGAIEISSAFTLNQSFSSIQTGIILFFLIGSEFFVSYRIRKSANTETGKDQDK